MSTSSRRVRAGHESGFSLVEMMVATVLLAIGGVGATGAIISSTSLNSQNREVGLATHGARRTIEWLDSLPYQEVLDRFVSPPSSDGEEEDVFAPPLAFSVDGLSPARDDPDQIVGAILLPLGGARSAEVSLGGATAFSGEAWDLDLDGSVGSKDRSTTNPRILPVVVRVDWRGPAGTQRIELRTVLVED